MLASHPVLYIPFALFLLLVAFSLWQDMLANTRRWDASNILYCCVLTALGLTVAWCFVIEPLWRGK